MRPPKRACWLVTLALAVAILRPRRRTPAERADDLRWRWM